MNYYRDYTTTKEDLDALKNMKHLGARLNYIREIAENQNHGEFTVNKLAAKAGTAQSTISRIEAGELQDPKGSLLLSIASNLSVPPEVFYSEYYQGDPKLFVICGYHKLSFDVDILEPVYRIELTVEAYNRDNVKIDSRKQICGVSVLELEEVLDDAESMIQKIHKRRIHWEEKKESYLELKRLSGAE